VSKLGFALLLLLAIAAPASSKSPTPYSTFRPTLVHSGWRPEIVIVVDALGAQERDWGDARLMKDFGFIEIERCTGVGRNFCFFNFRKGTICKRVTTAGELARNGSSPVVLKIETDRCARLRSRAPQAASE
jgi:hypothetical protein